MIGGNVFFWSVLPQSKDTRADGNRPCDLLTVMHRTVEVIQSGLACLNNIPRFFANHEALKCQTCCSNELIRLNLDLIASRFNDTRCENVVVTMATLCTGTSQHVDRGADMALPFGSVTSYIEHSSS